MLPQSLLDLTLARLAQRTALVGTEHLGQHQRRHISSSAVKALQQAVLSSKTASPLSFNPYAKPRKETDSKLRPLQVRPSELDINAIRASNPLSMELATRVQALGAIAVQTVATATATPDESALSEEELLSLYSDVMQDPPPDSFGQANTEQYTEQSKAKQLAHDIAVLDAVYLRLQEQLELPEHDEVDSPFVQKLRERTSLEIPSRKHKTFGIHKQPHRMLLTQVETFLKSVAPKSARLSVPIIVMTMDEWAALIRISLRSKDVEGAKIAFELMQRTGVPVTDVTVNDLLEYHAQRGMVLETEQILKGYSIGPPTDSMKHSHVRAHLRATAPNKIPTGALDVLHGYETENNLPALKTYTSVITALFKVPDSMANAHAWDLYAHTRYVAHPDPDPLLYTMMIRACASPMFSTRAADPERALDLWTEMTVDHKIRPTVGAYNAIILACARSGTKTYVNEAYRLAKEMFELYKDAQGKSTMTPDRKTFNALLEGAKRTGDLTRARWVLAKLSKLMAETGSKDYAIDEEVMLHVLHTYTTYTPPFKRGRAPMKQDTRKLKEPVAPSDPRPSAVSKNRAAVTSFAHLPPQSRAEVLVEADSIFYRCISESANTGGHFDKTLSFGNVRMSARLVNSFLSVHYKHDSLFQSRILWHRIFEEAHVDRNARTFKEALERCIMTEWHEKEDALRFGQEVFQAFTQYEASGAEKIDARTIERIHGVYIRLLSLSGNIDEALDHLKTFFEKYPPADVRRHLAKPALRSTRTSLYASRPLVRMSSTTDLPDSHVPPLLLFRDIDVLHHRCIDKDNKQGIAFVKYVCKSYEWALRVRRDNSLKAKPVKNAGVEAVEEEEEEGVSQEWL